MLLTSLFVFVGTAFIASVAAVWRRHLAAALYFVGALAATAFFVWSHYAPLLSYSLARSLSLTLPSLLIIPGVYWFLSAKKDKASIASQYAAQPKWRRCGLAVATASIVLIVATGTAISVGVQQYSYECGGVPAFVRPRSPDQAVFIARVMHSDRIFGNVAVVERQFWGCHFTPRSRS